VLPIRNRSAQANSPRAHLDKRQQVVQYRQHRTRFSSLCAMPIAPADRRVSAAENSHPGAAH
jgi:hypothetical protein